MRRLLLLVFMMALAGMIPAQQSDSLLAVPPDEIDSLLTLLDVIEAAEVVVLRGERLPASQVAELRELARVADSFAAEDLGARARSLLALAQSRRAPVPEQPVLDQRLGPSTDRRLVRDSEAYQTIAMILGTTGAGALTFSTLFYVLAERDYQRYLSETDPGVAGQLYQAWRGYDLLSLGMGGAAVAAGGIGLPLLFALSAEPSYAAVQTPKATYTSAERRDRLVQLYEERADIVSRLNRLGDRGPRRDLVKRIGFATGLIGTVTSFTMFYLAEETYQEYLAAPFSDDAEALGDRVDFFDFLALTSGTLSAAGFGTAIGVEAFTFDRGELEERLRAVNLEIVEVRTAPPAVAPAAAPSEGAE